LEQRLGAPEMTGKRACFRARKIMRVLCRQGSRKGDEDKHTISALPPRAKYVIMWSALLIFSYLIGLLPIELAFRLPIL
jgi:hypothetical protein